VLLVLVIALSVAAIWRLREKPKGFADPAVVGTWSDGVRFFTLRPDGGYWAAVVEGSGGLLSPTECGRWSADDGALHMRASWQAQASTPGDVVRFSSPGLHLGSWKGTPPSELLLYTAVASHAPEARHAASLHRTPTPVSEAMPAPGRHALEAACGMHLPD